MLYFYVFKSVKSVAVGKFRKNDQKTIFPKKIFGSKKERYCIEYAQQQAVLHIKSLGRALLLEEYIKIQQYQH